MIVHTVPAHAADAHARLAGHAKGKSTNDAVIPENRSYDMMAPCLLLMLLMLLVLIMLLLSIEPIAAFTLS